MKYRTFHSPIGPLLVAGDDEGLRFLLFQRVESDRPPRGDRFPRRGVDVSAWDPDEGALDEVIRQLSAYFSGTLREFSVPVAPQGTSFQKSVWAELQNIHYGETVSYGELARRIGNVKAVRAVGLANGANPISIIIPCHRVIGSNGTLVGYGGGLSTKQTLLALERGQAPLL